MIITDIEEQRNKKRVNIYINDNFAFGLDKEILYKNNLYIGLDIGENNIKDLLKEEERKKTIDSCLRYLSFRQHSEKEIYQKLKAKDFEEDDILWAIDYCKSKNYINDQDFAIAFINDKRNLNNMGQIRIKAELLKRGISREIIDEFLKEDFDLEYDMALILAEKKLASYKKDDKNSKYRKLGAYLARKGYSYEIVGKILNELID